MAERSSSINDVARLAGVSAATVSNVLTRRKPVSPALAAKVEAAVRALNYRVDPLASMLRSGEARIVAVLAPDLDNPFFTSIVSAVEQQLGHDAYEVIVASSHDAEATEHSKLRAMLAWRPAGLVVVPCSDAFPGRELIEAAGTPYVIADRVAADARADSVALDNDEAGRAGARHLIELGHRRVLIAATSLTLANIRQRCRGAAEIFAANGLPAPEVVELGFESETAARQLSAWFAQHPAPTAIQALTNSMTLAALTTIAERGLKLPRDISLIGFDDYPWMSARATPLTAVAQPVREMGRCLWERLNARIRGDATPPAHIRLPCELKVRQSTAPPPRLKAARAAV